MRVIAGIHRGRRLESLEGRDIRPTADRVKESLFNILGSAVLDSNFLDLFGGTGGIGIEALSRGAQHVVFVDESIRSIKVLRSNLEQLKITDEAEVYNTDYTTAIKKLHMHDRRFGIIYIDPPYATGIAQKALEEINSHDILEKDGYIVVEHEVRDAMPDQVGRLVMFRSKLYGNTRLSFYVAGENTDQHKEESL